MSSSLPRGRELELFVFGYVRNDSSDVAPDDIAQICLSYCNEPLEWDDSFLLPII